MIPETWATSELGNLIEKPQYGHTASASEDPSGPRFLRITDIQGSRVDWDLVPSCQITKAELEKYALANSDIVFARTGATTGKSYLISNCPRRAVFASYLIRIRPRSGVVPSFLWYFFHSPKYWLQISEEQAGIAQPGVNATKLQRLIIVVAPCAEQRRIVDAIETQLTRLDAAVASLKRVGANLKRARASVLKAAVEGRLVPTEAELARQEGRSYEHASVLLERILEERRRRHDEDQVGAKRKKKYKPPVEPEGTKGEELPNGWVFATVDQLSGFVKYGTSAKCSTEDLGVPVLRMGNIADGRLTYENLKYLPKDHSDFPDQFLSQDEVLFNRTNSAELVGKSAVFKGLSRPVACASYLIRVGVLSGASPDFLASCINSPRGRSWIKTVVSQQVGQANVNGTKLRHHTVALPPEVEQTRIVDEMERRLSVLDAIDQTVAHNLQRCERLRQSILKRAFEGKLVPQDPNDEPASELLARIKAEAAAK